MLRNLLILSALLGLALAYCPNGCSSPNGVCSDAEVCQCTEGWAGDDCSVSDTELRNHVPVEAHVETRQWRFFHLLANSQQQSAEFEVNQTGTGGDIDVYVRVDKYPTRQEYDMRDISTSKNMRFEVPSPHGVYYIGVYGFLGSDFTVMATLKTNCPNDCSGHGICSFNGECACREGYASADCSSVVYALENDQEVTGTLASREWAYYRLSNTDNTVEFTLTVDEMQDADIYVKLGALPTLNDFDFRNTGISTESVLRIAGAQVGSYYVGVVGFTETSDFTLLTHTLSECPNQCSGESHGNCSDTFECVCNDGFIGDKCETRDLPLSLVGLPQTGFVSGNVWNYYSFITFTTTNVMVSLDQLNEDADCDLYIKRGEAPSRANFDYRDISYDEHVSITIQNPAVNNWFVGVFGFKECMYSINTQLTMSCPNNCIDEDHGTCVNGHCVCKDDWMTEDCSLKSAFLENGAEANGTITSGEWKFFHFNAVPNTRISIVLHEESSVGNVWLYESVAGNPSLSVFDHADSETNTDIHRITSSVDEPTRVNIGVYGSILATPNIDYGFHLVAWQATFSPPS